MKTFREILQARGLTPTQAARESGIPMVTIAMHYYGQKKVSAASAIRYEEKLGIPREEIRPDYWPPQRGGIEDEET